MSPQMSLHSKRFVFPSPFLSLQTSLQLSLLPVFSTIQSVQKSYIRNKYKKSRKKRLK